MFEPLNFYCISVSYFQAFAELFENRLKLFSKRNRSGSSVVDNMLDYQSRDHEIIPRFSGLSDHWLGAYRTNALYSGHIFVRFNDLEDVFT